MAYGFNILRSLLLGRFPGGGHSESNWRHVRPQNSTSKKDPYKVPRMFSKSDPYKVKLLIYNTLMLHTFESNYDVHTLKYANKIWSRANIHLEYGQRA